MPLRSSAYLPSPRGECASHQPSRGVWHSTDETIEYVLDDLDKAIIADALDFGDYHEPLQWQNEKQVLQKLEANTDLINTSIETGLFHNQKTNSPMGAILSSEQHRIAALSIDPANAMQADKVQHIKDSLIQQLLVADANLDSNATPQQIDQWHHYRMVLSNAITGSNQQLQSLYAPIAQTTLAQLQSVQAENNAVLPEQDIELWHKQINNIYLSTIAVGTDTFTKSQWDTICQIAFKCPLEGGEAVYRARGLYATVHDTLFDDKTTCTEAGYAYKKEKNEKPKATTTQQLQFQLMPNPANDVVTLRANQNLSNEVHLQIIDYIGRIAVDKNISFINQQYTFNLNRMSSGIYLVKLFHNNTLQTITLNIVK